jgi:hypothetical protein
MPSSSTSSFSRYLVRVLLLVVGALALALGGSLVLVKYVVEPNDRVIQSLALVTRSTATDAAFGDSRFAWGFVGRPDFPTIAAEGETMADMELRVRYYFRDKQPGRVVLQGDPHAFATYKLDRATHAYLNNLDNRFWQRFVDHHRPYLGKYWELFATGGTRAFRPRDALRWGWIVGQEEWSALDPTVRLGQARARVEHHLPAADFEHDVFAQSFERTLSFLQERGAHVCVITTPVSYEYYKFASQNPTTAEAIEFIRHSAEQHGDRYVNFYDLFARPEFADYFRDMDHLNQRGAPLFTEKAVAACFGRGPGAIASRGH